MEDSPPQSKSWSIHTRHEITSKYEILERVGSGAYSDVYKALRRSDSVIVALKEVHDYPSAYREIEALQTLKNCPNVVVLSEYFLSDDDDAVLVLEYLPTDLGAIIEAAKKEWEGGISIGEVKQWMVQILRGIDACHRNCIVHRDLKPSNLLISADGVLKIADFGQARILLAPEFAADDGHVQSHEYHPSLEETVAQLPEVHILDSQLNEEHRVVGIEECGVEPEKFRVYSGRNDIDEDSMIHDGSASCFSCIRNDPKDPFQHSSSYEAEEDGNDGIGPLTSCVGTRWYRAPELLYGSTTYGFEIDLWSVGCIFSELLILEPIFPGSSDIDQLGKIFSILGNVTEEVWPGCAQLPDYNLISFGKVENPIGLEVSLQNQSSDEVLLVKKLLRFDPLSRATAMELLDDKFLNEEPLPVQLSDLRIPSKHGNQDQDSSAGWNDYGDFKSDSDFDDFGSSSFTTTENGFSIRFS